VFFLTLVLTLAVLVSCGDREF